jgi:radical SAM protein with 4Fe4S-binding SPASM domain
MRSQEYSAWSLGLHQGLVHKRIPVSGSIEVTHRCNNRCLHCYNNLAAGNREAASTELTLDEYRRILDDITAAGCLWLLFTGGEIFLRDDFLDIYTYARKKGLLITLFTNGTLMTADIADELKRLPPFSIEITIYGHSRETWESVTRLPGSYQRCLNGIDLMMTRGLPIKLKTMAISPNKKEIGEMRQFAEERLGLEFKFDTMINPRIDRSMQPVDVRLTPAEVVELDLKYKERSDELSEFAARFNNARIDSRMPQQLYSCGAGNQSFAIDPYGRLRVCILSSGCSYELRQGSFREGWEGHLAVERQKKPSQATKCSSCGLRSMCGMCPANGELECANPETPVDYLCQTAHLRAYALGLKIGSHGACEYCPGGSRYEQLMETAEVLRERCA